MRPTSRSPLKPRPTPTRKYTLTIIGAEGKTEAAYFDIFNTTRVQVISLPPGEDNRSTPEQALDRLDLYREKNQIVDGDTFWLMVDADKWLQEGKQHVLHTVCGLAEQRGVGLALSNPCFEIWLLLHHSDADAADLTYAAVRQRIVAVCGQGQGKTAVEADRYVPLLQAAIDRARALDTDPAARWPEHPGTHVYKVVEQLL